MSGIMNSINGITKYNRPYILIAQAGVTNDQKKVEGNTPIEKKVDNYIKNLDSNDIQVRLDAVNALVDLARTNASPEVKIRILEGLLKALEDKMSFVIRAQAASGLRYLVSSDLPLEVKVKMIDPLIKALGDEFDETRWDVSFSLVWFMESEISVEEKERILVFVFQTLTGEKVDGRRGAANFFEELSGSDVSSEIKSRAVDPLIARLNDEDPFVRDDVADALSKFAASDISPAMKTKMIKPFIGLLGDNSGARYGASDGLKNLVESDIPNASKDEIVNLLIISLKSKNDDIITGALIAFEKLARSKMSLELKNKMIDPLFELLDTHGVLLGRIFVGLLSPSFSPGIDVTMIRRRLIKALSVGDLNTKVGAVSALRTILATMIVFPEEEEREMVNALVDILADVNTLKTSDTIPCMDVLECLVRLGHVDLLLQRYKELIPGLVAILQTRVTEENPWYVSEKFTRPIYEAVVVIGGVAREARRTNNLEAVDFIKNNSLSEVKHLLKEDPSLSCLPYEIKYIIPQMRRAALQAAVDIGDPSVIPDIEASIVTFPLSQFDLLYSNLEKAKKEAIEYLRMQAKSEQFIEPPQLYYGNRL